LDVDSLIEQLERLLAEARPVPLSSSVMVNRAEVEELLGELRSRLPEELRQARWVLKERDDVLAQAGREAEQIVADARDERDRMVSEQEVTKAAHREADRVVDDAREQARVLRLEAEDYVDGKLANFEIVLQKTMKQVEKGRERLRGRLASDALVDEPVEAPDAEEAPAAEQAGPEDPGRGIYDYEALEGGDDR
jgi:cell division septum initiation protein DivIVA